MPQKNATKHDKPHNFIISGDKKKTKQNNRNIQWISPIRYQNTKVIPILQFININNQSITIKKIELK